ncbi:hypothetical protein AX768_25315 [Burkholderia sp. PAMC 28687]|nr:hypothetical protein AX768_25315 [Burkholderia sp. PAMC 28687]
MVGGLAGVLSAGYFLGQWSARDSVEQANTERKAMTARIPVIRKEEYAAGVASSETKIASLQKQIDDAGDIKAMVQDAHEIVAYTLRFLGKRAEITDARNAALLKQSRTAAAAAVEAKQSLDKVDKKLTEQAVKVDAAASAVQNVEKKLAPPPPPAQPSKGWFGFGGH